MVWFEKIDEVLFTETGKTNEEKIKEKKSFALDTVLLTPLFPIKA